ncbi:transcriptional regulator [Escherichia coli]|nr:transcriptional regulator [Escherichia coli]
MAAVNLRHIEIFHAVMTAGSLTEAAHLLHTSQPTVSRELARFEKVIGLKCLSAYVDDYILPCKDCVCLKKCNDPGTDWIALSAPQKVCASFARENCL